MGFLDKAGLSYYTGKLRALLAGKQDKLTPDETITMRDGGISVRTPVKTLTRAEYDALAEEEKQAEAVYLVEEPQWTPVPLSIQDYDTDDGWHVRKWSDGYVEMILNKSYDVAPSQWNSTNLTNTFSSVARLFPSYSYPIQLKKIISETPVCFADGWTLFCSLETDANRLSQTQVGRPFAAGIPTTQMKINYTTTITGRWK